MRDAQTKGCANSVIEQDGTVTLQDVRSIDGDYTSAALESVNGQWRLLDLAL